MSLGDSNNGFGKLKSFFISCSDEDTIRRRRSEPIINFIKEHFSPALDPMTGDTGDLTDIITGAYLRFKQLTNKEILRHIWSWIQISVYVLVGGPPCIDWHVPDLQRYPSNHCLIKDRWITYKWISFKLCFLRKERSSFMIQKYKKM